MDRYSQAKSAYSITSRTTTSDPKSIEYQVFVKVTGRLLKANANRKDDFNEFAAALYDNSRLWTTLAADVLSDENELDEALKVQLLNLANYSRQHASKALKEDIGADALISINNTIMRGLRGEIDAGTVSASENIVHAEGV